MTDVEAKMMLSIMITADEGCHVCSRKLFSLFAKQWPDFALLAVDTYNREWAAYSVTLGELIR